MTERTAPVVTGSGSTAYVGIGSNLERPVRQVLAARDALAELPGTHLLAVSPLYRNPAVGPGVQPDFVNAVAAIATELAPEGLLAALQGIESRQGRARGRERWAARTLDLDLLLYGERVFVGQALSVPHPRMHERIFVLKPLVDVAPDVAIPGHGAAAALLARLDDAPMRRIPDEEIMREMRPDEV